MKKQLYLFFLLFVINVCNSQILNFSAEIQEQDQWCWAGVSKSILDYYGESVSQCQIAEYARTVIDWHNFGSINCCLNPSQGCNYWNYNWGNAGSIQDILVHFGSIQNYGFGNKLSLSQITTEISAGRPFVIRWGWVAGGGHFLVGYGISNTNSIHYMNPWFGEGLHISTYSWMVGDGNHDWTHTNILTTNPLGSSEFNIEDVSISISPNPASQLLTISAKNNFESIEILNVLGASIYAENNINSTESSIDVSAFQSGIYLVEIVSNNKNYISKFIKN